MGRFSTIPMRGCAAATRASRTRRSAQVLAAGGALVAIMVHTEQPAAGAAAPVRTLAFNPPDLPGGGGADFHERINEAWGVYHSDLQHLDLGGALPGEPLMVFIELEGEPVVVDMHPFSNRAPGYQVLRQIDAQEYVPAEPGVLRTLRGDIVGVPESSASGSLMVYGLDAHVMLMPGVDYWIEPVSKKFADADPDLYIIYRGDQIKPTGLNCGNDEFPDFVNPRGDDPDALPVDGGGGGTVHVTELACDADFEFFSFHGSTSAVEDKINAIINTMNEQYERDVAIRHDITTIIVRETSNDPYSDTRKANKLLDEMKDHWNAEQGAVQRDVAHLFTGRDIQSTTIGLAFLGVICDLQFAYSFVQELSGFGFACETDLSAHELGHNWDADHCPCPNNTMNASLPCANAFHPTETIPEILAHRDSRNCLDEDVTFVIPDVTGHTAEKGTQRTGDNDSLTSSDNDYVKIDSTTSGKRKARLRVELNSACTEADSIDVAVELGCSESGGRTKVYLYDFNQSKWVKIGAFSQPKGDTEQEFEDISNPNRFIDDSGNMRMRIFTKITSTSFTQKIDLAQVTLFP